MGIRGFEDLVKHVGHEIEIVTYTKDGEIFNAAIECLTCDEVLLDFDKE